MEFSASAEVYKDADPGLNMVRRCVITFLKAALGVSTLATLDAKLRYTPIAMPVEMQARYPARSRLRKKQRIYDCAPVLNYDVFVTGTFEEQLREYIAGLAPSAPYLATFGATPEQIEEFKMILADALIRIPIELPGEPRH